MKTYLQAGFGEPVGRQSLEWIRAIGFRGIRLVIPWAAPAERLDELLRELAEAGLGAVLLLMSNLEYCNGGKMKEFPDNWRPSAIQIADYARELAIHAEGYLRDWYLEIGNEPNLGKHGGPLAKDPKRFGRWLHTVPRHVWEAIPDAKIISGGICGLHKKSLNYLERVLNAFPAPVDDRIIIGFHPYRTEKTFAESNRDIEENLCRLRGLIGSRRFAVTEIGWHTAPQKTYSILPCCRKEFRFTDQGIAEFATLELDAWQKRGAELLCWYQLNDGPNEFYSEDCFGIRDHDGRRKPVADAIERCIKGSRE